jgi:hypothetical protein
MINETLQNPSKPEQEVNPNRTEAGRDMSSLAMVALALREQNELHRQNRIVAKSDGNRNVSADNAAIISLLDRASDIQPKARQEHLGAHLGINMFTPVDDGASIDEIADRSEAAMAEFGRQENEQIDQEFRQIQAQRDAEAASSEDDPSEDKES